jgi:hypothetical protein
MTQFDANGNTLGQAQAELIAEDFTAYLNEFHGYREPYDDALKAELMERYVRVLRTRTYYDFKSQPHFSPSSANADDRELYEKINKAKRDEQEVTPFQRRWTALGTAMGDMMQYELLLAEKHYPKFTGKTARFTFERTADGDPMFEDFVKTMTVIKHKGKAFSLFGTTDGIMRYVAPDGEVLRVGLEIKSKQTTHAQTSFSSMKEAKEDHVKQCVCYSLMYGVDYFVILYVNASKKGWFMGEDDFAKYPDIRAFGVYVTEEMKQAVLDKFARIIQHVDLGIAPRLDVDKWTFNNFKRATALSLNEDELADIVETVERIRKSRMPDWKKRQYVEMLEFIQAVRNGER